MNTCIALVLFSSFQFFLVFLLVLRNGNSGVQPQKHINASGCLVNIKKVLNSTLVTVEQFSYIYRNSITYSLT